MPSIHPEALIGLVGRIFQAAGAPEATAQQVAHSLVASDQAGHGSHGVVRVSQYLDSMEAGELDPAAQPVKSRETAVVTLVDGRHGFGQPAARLAMTSAMEKAAEQGLAAAGLCNCGHVGRLGEWVEMAAAGQMIGLAFCNGGRGGGIVAPYGGAGRVLGTNPVAAAIPLAGRPPLVLDFATSAVAEGKVRLARNRGQAIPEGWIVDRRGRPSTDPEDLYAGGALLPAAGHKGYGLSLLVEFLGGILTGSGCPALPGFVMGNGVLFLALGIDVFRPVGEFLADGEALVARVKGEGSGSGEVELGLGGPGGEEILLPGEPEQRAAAERREGVPVDEATWKQLCEAAAGLGVEVGNGF